MSASTNVLTEDVANWIYEFLFFLITHVLVTGKLSEQRVNSNTRLRCIYTVINDLLHVIRVD